MAWDITQPTDTTKIRNLGVVIRPNWEALQTAGATCRLDALNFKDRTSGGLPVNPTAINDTYITFCKEASVGVTELYGIDEASNVVQFTNAGRIGGPTQNFNINTYRFGTAAVDYSRNNIVHAYGQFTNSGATVVASGCTIAKVATGRYRVTFSIALTNTLYVAVATPFNEGNLRYCKIDDKTTAQFDIFTYDSDAAARDVGGFFMVCGGF
jgi:hypothetical protein